MCESTGSSFNAVRFVVHSWFLSFMRFILPNLPFRLAPVLSRLTIASASLLVEFMGPFGDLWCQADRFLRHCLNNAPPDHRDFHGIVND
jgi:hypothetical protein